ncbi:MAG: pantoate--beta-alanine ligase [Firmicutes bacterium]|nr:pantoate--beta-alanine ligase [Bacillota bacterium]
MTLVFHSIAEVQQWVGEARNQGGTVALVPTMGSLHEGHLALVREAQQRASHVVVSIFVNPLQFGPAEDLKNYPRDLSGDVARLSHLGTSAVFAPGVEEMYPGGPSATRVTVEGMSGVLCGRTRPTHFQGVTTVVAKLFHIVRPDVAVFGEKDWQQLAIIRRMVRDLNFGIDIVGVPIVRESSGLARSSRNQYLTAEDRSRAQALSRALEGARVAYLEGERRREVLRSCVLQTLRDAGLNPEYVEVVEPETLEQSPEALRGPAVIALAVRVGAARLIDNVILGRS